MNRDYEFINKKYKEILIPNIAGQLSDKIGGVIDAIIIGILIGSSHLPAITAAAPFLLISGIIDFLYGQGGSLQSLRAKSDFDYEKSNKIFTLSLIVSTVSVCYM